MAISGIGGIDPISLLSGQSGSALARTNSLQYTGNDLVSSLAGLAGGAGSSSGLSGQDAASADSLGIDGLGLSAADLGLARQGGASASSAAGLGRVGGVSGGSSFEDSLLKAIDGVNADQQKTSNLIQQMVVAPDSVNAHDVTIAMAEANLSLNLAKTILNRIVTGWKDVINTR
ncbi:MAG TPA: flagellar hook-basal body complex protein FliE [Rectinemataceae bacterium]|nr:flagellar hook-basal body complex protein FliE [Rectinemataceae bacterium]